MGVTNLQDEIVRVEGRVELVDQYRQTTNLITQRFRDLKTHLTKHEEVTNQSINQQIISHYQNISSRKKN